MPPTRLFFFFSLSFRKNVWPCKMTKGESERKTSRNGMKRVSFYFFFLHKKMFYRKIVFQLCKCRILVTILNGNSSYGFGSFNSLVPLTNGILTLFFYFEIIGKIGCKTCGCENFWNSLPQKKEANHQLEGV